ncbi:SHOCT domain-containing protein [Marichromatium sp. AB31]|uniref:Putative membrane protein n=1 Tax=Marichromatium gracile TaxID=1048 RepID=A0A4R4AHV8_MARGR|nr:SHOCT domain-containing protein [Marichromatium sp. AB31]MBK1708253.1 hypothetical protein [Marichromatium gracile]RNE90771.1 SHOCT domain-containing protein [Marichromatium sp. AB31]RNE94456.1 SHOCT domain-containing protein [Marichromatium sp. AB32]TCW38286.1 putative membrane protein [Marichromatium gracile]
MHHGWIPGGLGWIFWVLVILGVVWALRAGRRDGRGREGCASEEALRILESRYARGEIEHDEFERRREDLLR